MRVISGGGQMRAPGPWPQNPATIGNSTYTLQIVRRGRVTGHYHIYERRRPRSAISPLFVEPVHLVYCRRHLLPRDIASLTSLHCSLRTLESISSHSHPCHRSYGFLFWGEQNRVFILSGIYYISLSFSRSYTKDLL